ncbi:MAG TPA: hypothetical protein VM434_03165 [Beijerinckiaceae bacterium]|nr:hypothetical protein [Beijerinckiaceae bacterium]
MPVIRSDRGLVFTADAFAELKWRERSSGGRMLEYGAYLWRGKIGERRAYLSFALIPGTSGPNHHMDYRMDRYRVRPAWRRTGTRYELDRWFVVRDGPLRGEWIVVNCAAK